jgi:hypothetical protein
MVNHIPAIAATARVRGKTSLKQVDEVPAGFLPHLGLN